ncbi:hypothetical protein [Halocatena halophila]|uniref:hypothetical protein n=1 Tax=Halocatena halophila TaxID=2814576 RepID=UPI002ED5083D
MTLPLFLFRDEDRNCVNPSTVDSRSELSEAELYHVVDIGTRTWCRPCQSTGCPHATRIEQILTMADLASERTSYEHCPESSESRAITPPARFISSPSPLKIQNHHSNGSTGRAVRVRLMD